MHLVVLVRLLDAALELAAEALDDRRREPTEQLIDRRELLARLGELDEPDSLRCAFRAETFGECVEELVPFPIIHSWRAPRVVPACAPQNH